MLDPVLLCHDGLVIGQAVHAWGGYQGSGGANPRCTEPPPPGEWGGHP